nr:MAG TPA: helix-turn-helix domain protein [Caudoviricetes sp.]
MRPTFGPPRKGGTPLNAVQTALNARINSDGVSIRAFAKQVGLSRTTLARKLSGESDFTLGEIAAISAALGYETPSHFMADAETRTEEAA